MAKKPVVVFVLSFLLVLVVGIGLRLLFDTVILGIDFSDINMLSLMLPQIGMSIVMGAAAVVVEKKANKK
jgi:hypothetical protein